MRFSTTFQSLALSAAIGLSLSSCHPPETSWNPQVATGWRASTYSLSQNQTLKLIEEATKAQKEGEREVCGGVFVRDDGQLSLCYTPNESPDPRSFIIAKDNLTRMSELAAAHDSRLVGSFHSHPISDAAPGQNDLSSAGVNSLILIHSVPSGQTRLWQVVIRDEKKVAQEVQLEVRGRRPRSASTMIPSRREEGDSVPDWDLR